MLVLLAEVAGEPGISAAGIRSEAGIRSAVTRSACPEGANLINFPDCLIYVMSKIT